MKASLASAVLFGVQTLAFPAALINGDLPTEELAKITVVAEKIAAQAQKRQLGLDLVDVGFDSKAQKLDTSGDHAYVSSFRSLASIALQWLTIYRKRLVQMTFVGLVLA